MKSDYNCVFNITAVRSCMIDQLKSGHNSTAIIVFVTGCQLMAIISMGNLLTYTVLKASSSLYCSALKWAWHAKCISMQ